jgi:hypothetical protein
VALEVHAKRADATLCTWYGTGGSGPVDDVLILVKECQWSTVMGRWEQRTPVLVPMTMDY